MGYGNTDNEIIQIDNKDLQNQVTDNTNKIGLLSDLKTTDKFSLVGATNEITSQLADIALFIDSYPIQTPEANDNGRFQRLMSDISANGGGTILLKPKATYTVNQWVLDSNVIVLGNGATIKYSTDSSDATTDNNVVYALSKNNIVIRDLFIDGGKAVGTSANVGQHGGIWLEDCDGIYLEHVEAFNTGCDGIAIRSCYNYTLFKCKAHDTHEDGIVVNHDVAKWGQPTKNINAQLLFCEAFNTFGDAILTKVPDVLIMGCKSINAGENNTLRSGGIIVGTDGDIQPKNITVMGNYAENVTGAGIYSAAADHIIITGNQVKNDFNVSTLVDSNRGIELVTGTYSGTTYHVNKAIIHGNIVESRNEGIYCHGVINSDIKDNKVKTSAVGKSAIYVDNATVVSNADSIKNNVVEVETTNTIAIHVIGSNSAEAEGNKIVSAYDGIVFENVSNGKINGTKIDSGVVRNGITSKDSSCLIASNRVKGCGTTGIWLRGATNQYTKDNFVTGNQVTGCANGVFADSTVGKNVATGNHLFGNTVNINMNIATTGSIGDSTNNTVY